MKDTALPQTEAGIEISTEENDILTKTTSSSLVAIHLQFEGQTIQRVEKDDICTISEISISGCYSCSKGAMVKVKCEAKSNQRIEAMINYGTLGINFVECHKNGHPTQFTVFSSLKRINSSCFSQCGKKKIKFQLDGTLAEEVKFHMKQVRENFVGVSKYWNNSTLWEDVIKAVLGPLTNLWNGLINWLGTTTFIIVIIIGSLMVFHLL
ncbi:hypothetical protein L3Y34_013543 [Caenorhabditis briggsae]|uniref:Phlebovirus glycoprotein G2 C-terminal domain-containing protein n=1 Tax=Caenorhabditis briggsae TaxID=6238 RepID=A0AAE9A1W5_CAEBR|nr:hypothetical protein L3Y34_013543 [Caenorhabditis briggsae]